MQYFWLLALIVCRIEALAHPSHPSPLATVRNGTLSGIYSPEYEQDFFLGIPYAEPPLEELRFSAPRSLNSAWHGVKTAAEYSPECVGYGVSLSK